MFYCIWFSLLLSLLHSLDWWSRVLLIRRHRTKRIDTAPDVTVVVTAHNERLHLAGLLNSLKAQTRLPKAVTIVLDRCTDGSLQWLLDHHPDVEVIVQEKVPRGWHPRKSALHRGITNAKTEWVLLTDADCRPNRDWTIEMGKRFAADQDFVIGLSPYQSRPGLLNALIQYETWITTLYMVSMTMVGRPYMALGRNLALRRKAYEKTGYGYLKSQQGGDDDLLIQRLRKQGRGQVVCDPRTHVTSIPKDQWVDWWQQKIRHYRTAKNYHSPDLWIESARWVVHMGFWLGPWICGFSGQLWLPLSVLILGLLGKILCYKLTFSELGGRFHYLLMPFLDFLYIIIVPVLGMTARVKKQTAWK